jgi:hypothetical protein
MKSEEMKSRLNDLVSRKIVKGVFEVHTTFDCDENQEQMINDLQLCCEGSKLKLFDIEMNIRDAKRMRRQQIRTTFPMI